MTQYVMITDWILRRLVWFVPELHVGWYRMGCSLRAELLTTGRVSVQRASVYSVFYVSLLRLCVFLCHCSVCAVYGPCGLN